MCIITTFVENIVAVDQSVVDGPNMSLSGRAQHLGLYFGSLWRILDLDLHLAPYKGKLSQEVSTYINCN